MNIPADRLLQRITFEKSGKTSSLVSLSGIVLGNTLQGEA
jgi:hypothetical protein